MASGSVLQRVAGFESTERFSQRVNDIKMSPIKEMELLAAELTDVVSLGQGTPSFSTPEHIREFVRKKISEGAVDKYSLGPGIKPLREAIAEKLQYRNNISADPGTEILVTVGANEALSMTMLALINPGDEVLVFSPGYSPHIEQIRLAGGQPTYVPLEQKGRWQVDIERLESAVTPRTRALIVSSPMNPTGTVIERETLYRIAEVAARNRLFIVSDETYEDFTYDGHRHFSIGSIPGVHNETISIFSFSKSYALTGWRCGYVRASRAVINQLLKIHDALCICTPLTAQYAGLAALNGSQECISGFREQLLRRRTDVLGGIEALSTFHCCCPEGAYYILARVDGICDSVDYCLSLLQHARVVLVPGAAFGPTAEGHVRLSYCMSEEVIVEAFSRIAQYEAARAKAVADQGQKQAD